MTTVVADVDQNESSTLAWRAVIAGGVASAAVTLLLLAFGAGLGLAAVSPWSDEGVSATTFHVGAGLYLIAVAMLSGTVDGYLACGIRSGTSRAGGRPSSGRIELFVATKGNDACDPVAARRAAQHHNIADAARRTVNAGL